MSKIKKTVAKNSKLKIWEKFDSSPNKIGIHLTWCTYKGEKFLIGDIKKIVENAIPNICYDLKCTCRNIDVKPDHICVFVQITPRITPHLVVSTLKTRIATEIICKYPNFNKKDIWTRKTFYNSIGEVSENSISKFVEKNIGSYLIG